MLSIVLQMNSIGFMDVIAGPKSAVSGSAYSIGAIFTGLALYLIVEKVDREYTYRGRDKVQEYRNRFTDKTNPAKHFVKEDECKDAISACPELKIITKQVQRVRDIKFIMIIISAIYLCLHMYCTLSDTDHLYFPMNLNLPNYKATIYFVITAWLLIVNMISVYNDIIQRFMRPRTDNIFSDDRYHC